MRPTKNIKQRYLGILCFLLGWSISTAQTLNKPTPADNPNLPGNSAWNAACASQDFNEYFINFTWNTPLVASDNKFILELSDANGSFGSPVELASESNKNTVFNFDFQFALPVDTRGENYKFRVRSTNPAKTSPASDAFPMYYIDFKSAILISQNGDGVIPPGGAIEICNGNSVTLAVHNVPNENTYKYIWYRSGTRLPDNGPSVTVSQTGNYAVEMDYGSICSSSANTLSNSIAINAGTSLGIAINPPAKTALCNGETVSLEANITGQGLTYTWYKDDVAITSPTVDDATLMVNASTAGFEGDYSVEIYGPGACLERSAAVTISNAGNFTVTLDNQPNVVILPSQTKTLSVSTTATSPVHQWYKDGTAISGATSNTLDVTQPGSYYAEVSQTGGACSATIIQSETTTVVAPASFEITTDYTTEYISCESTDITLAVTAITAVAADNTKTDVTSDLLSNFSYQWKKDGINITGETTSTLVINDANGNGNYTVEGTLNSYAATSNALPVQLRVNESITLSASSTVYCNPTDAITLSTTTDLSGETFEWLKDGTSYNSTDTELTVNSQGTYQLVVSKNGCPLKSNEVHITPLDESIVTLDSPEDIVFAEGGSKTVTASGADSYIWYDSNSQVLGNSPTVTFSNEGTYMLIATIGGCDIQKTLTVTYKDTFKVPNVISVNGDGINDLWVLPNSYSKNPEINIIIYDPNGVEVLNVMNYQNNWPSSSTAFNKQNMVYFYKIKNAKEVLKQGTITIIR
ncbi:gliding motility-associated C-terminal domain-containing protein [Flavobacteriaceae bacterium F89]|uniref:Gliding motility-associated C-terminal domain-containing protein n=1 Tax=Cerina litoralis TaxID=2874477 RepID=A0AAE3ESA7_9FLAO|nr:gliding motility-associated C-terminal domain-containing protein [Cerina litoralis]MCG2459219.1 gliding motility-associated C-terminal domain-containing protein [Cerina litoralis]